MALIHCPECNAEVSDTAAVCPHCGFDLKNRPVYEKKVSQLADLPIGTRGLPQVVIGAICFIGGIAASFITFWSLIFVLGGLIILGEGLAKREKMQTGKCPYCGAELDVKRKSQTVKCPVCGNISTKTESTLETRH